MRLNGNVLCKWSRIIHRELSFFLTGMLLIYVISGLVMNHRDSINPHYSVKRTEYRMQKRLPLQEQIDEKAVIELLKPLNEEKNYTKHYFPKQDELKVFLKGGSSLWVDLQSGEAVYESVHRRPILSEMTRLHYNPGKWWTAFSDFFAIGMMIVILSGMTMTKGKKGICGRGGIELAAGIAIPLIFLFFL